MQGISRSTPQPDARIYSPTSERKPVPLWNVRRHPGSEWTPNAEGSLAMPDYKWPEADQRTLIGKRITRVDSPLKVSGQAKYTYDVNRPGMLFGKMVRSPYAHCRVVSIDTSAAEKMPGVKAIQIVQAPGSQIFWQGDEVVAVAAVDERTAEDAVRAIEVQYQKLSHLVSDAEPPAGAGEG